jgi:tetratricopeptide (TPR) repeat protein
MRACALQETGGHDEALRLAADVRAKATQADHRLAADLIEALVTGCRGDHGRARGQLAAMIDDPEYAASPLIGYAYRFFEIVDGFIESLPRLMTSIEVFNRHGFAKSKAYSQLPAAMFRARIGDVAGAMDLINEAQALLAGEVRDQHMVLNNRAAVQLLADAPDFRGAIADLTFALRLARDDFTEITILSNLGLAHHGAGEAEAALDCAEKCMAILESHDFADTDIYWPVAFNAAVVFGAAGRNDRREAALRFPEERGRPRSDNQGYWAFRFGAADIVDDRYRFLAGRPWHPVYLSHWLIDLEGLNLLKTEPPQ